jgi:phosphoadenosine phosphosulfate reductase
LRADQTVNRAGMSFVSADAEQALLKVNPILDWSRDDVAMFVSAHTVPLNVLHTRGFPSIGCAPCTRGMRPGEPERAGRWWWEADDTQECGLHLAADGRPTRKIIG